MTTAELRRRALSAYETTEAAVAAAERLGNVAFVRAGVPLTCTREYVCDCINAGNQLEVLADYEQD